jgi:hypothetical protein
MDCADSGGMNWKQYLSPFEANRLAELDAAIGAAKMIGINATAEKRRIYDRCRRRKETGK